MNFPLLSAPVMAQALLGQTLIRKTAQGYCSGQIIETEAYSQTDTACHAFGGRRTAKTEALFKKAGYWYVYFTYGMYYCLNLSAGQENFGEGVLIRAVIPLEGIELMRQRRGARVKDKDLVNGPGKLCIAFNIDKSLNLQPSTQSSGLYLSATRPLSAYSYNKCSENFFIRNDGLRFISTPRIGLNKKCPDLLKPWRFFVTR